jgi:FAD/FMN-containing dehydrogenase
VIVLEDGSVLDASQPRVDPDGYDLVGLFVGSEGMFGIATEITVNLLSKPPAIETLLAIFPALGRRVRQRDRHHRRAPRAVGDRDPRQADDQGRRSERVRGGLSERSRSGVVARRRRQPRRSGDHRARHPADPASARSDRDPHGDDGHQRKQLWAGRKGAFGAMGRIAPDLYVADVCVPRTKLRELVLRDDAHRAREALKLANVFHAGDGNLHPNISLRPARPDEVRRVLEAGDEIMKLCIAAGGSLTASTASGSRSSTRWSWLFTPPTSARCAPCAKRGIRRGA